MRQMQGEIGKLAMEAADKILGSKAGAQTDSSIYDQFIEKAGDSHDETAQLLIMQRFCMSLVLRRQLSGKRRSSSEKIRSL